MNGYLHKIIWISFLLFFTVSLFAVDLQKDIFKARDSVLPALVHIEPVLKVFASGREQRMAVKGSGFVVSDTGLVLTNNHVVENAEMVRCTLSDEEEVEAQIVGRDAATDIALIKLDLKDYKGKLHPAKLGDSDNLQVGEHVIALGSPLGLYKSLSFGVVSSANRYIPSTELPSGETTGLYYTWIQTDAAINPGNSGGPLVNLRGEVIGINARAIPIFGENIGFAIPINVAKNVMPSLLSKGYVERSTIGVTFQNLKGMEMALGYKGDIGQANHLPDLSQADKKGVLIASIEQKSPADEGGLRVGDILLSLNNQPTSARFEEELPAVRKIESTLPIDIPIECVYLRDGKENRVALKAEPLPSEGVDEIEAKEWGVTYRSVTKTLALQKNLPVSEGCLITGVKPGSPAILSGISAGEIIQKAAETSVKNSNDLKEFLEKTMKEKTASILVTTRSGKATRFYIVKPDYGSGK